MGVGGAKEKGCLVGMAEYRLVRSFVALQHPFIIRGNV
jgi:hypothetical protein